MKNMSVTNRHFVVQVMQADGICIKDVVPKEQA